MNSEALKTFLVLADTGSGTKTAQRLMITQSAVSKRIKDLEEELNAKLFIRDRKNSVLTPAGKTFYTYAAQIIGLQEAACQELSLGNGTEDTLVIGCVDSLHDCHVSRLLTDFSQKHSNISVKLVINNSQDILNALYDGKIDICFSYRKFKDNNYICEQLWSDNVILATAPNNYSFPGGISDTQIMELPLIRENLTWLSDREWFEKIFAGCQHQILNIGTGVKIVPYLKSGLGYGFVVESFVAQDLQDGSLRGIKLLDRGSLNLNSYIIYRESNAEAKRIFTDFVREYQEE